jgi:hypothetical protein
MTIGMGMTEKQGGTDVRANIDPRRARWRARLLSPHWPQMVHVGADVDAFLMLAQAEPRACPASSCRASRRTAP